MSFSFDYPSLLRRAALGVVRDVLAEVAAEGFPGDHHLYLTFRTGHPEVDLPHSLRERFPETMTIVLQHQFWELEVLGEAFEVTLRFAGDFARLRVPYDALVSVLDPSVPFGIDFAQFATVDGEAPAEDATGDDVSDFDGSVATAEGDDTEDTGSGASVLPFRRPSSADSE